MYLPSHQAGALSPLAFPAHTDEVTSQAKHIQYIYPMLQPSG